MLVFHPRVRTRAHSPRSFPLVSEGEKEGEKGIGPISIPIAYPPPSAFATLFFGLPTP